MAHAPAVPWSISPAQATNATLKTQQAAARGSGSYGMSLTGSDQPFVIAGPAVAMDAGE